MTTKEFVLAHLRDTIMIAQNKPNALEDNPTWADLQVLGTLHKIIEDYEVAIFALADHGFTLGQRVRLKDEDEIYPDGTLPGMMGTVLSHGDGFYWCEFPENPYRYCEVEERLLEAVE